MELWVLLKGPSAQSAESPDKPCRKFRPNNPAELNGWRVTVLETSRAAAMTSKLPLRIPPEAAPIGWRNHCSGRRRRPTMSAATLIASLTHPRHDSIRVDTLRALWRGACTHLQRALCGLHGHTMVLSCEPARVRLRCVSCGAATPGWRIEVQPRYRALPPPRARIVRAANDQAPQGNAPTGHARFSAKDPRR
jgi:hypothetical protein